MDTSNEVNSDFSSDEVSFDNNKKSSNEKLINKSNSPINITNVLFNSETLKTPKPMKSTNLSEWYSINHGYDRFF